MDKFYTVCRFVAAVLTTTARSMRPDCILTSAEFRKPSGAVDATSLLVGRLAVGGGKVVNDAEWRLVVWYTYRGQGPFALYVEPAGTLTFPPEQARDLVPPGEQIIMAERRRPNDEETEDVTELLCPFAGPDGLFHGRIDFAAGKGDFDMKVIFPDWEDGDQLELTMATGDTTQYPFTV